jgi:hypothetical protein
MEKMPPPQRENAEAVLTGVLASMYTGERNSFNAGYKFLRFTLAKLARIR